MTTDRLAALLASEWVKSKGYGEDFWNAYAAHLAAAGVTVGPCDRPHRRIAHLPPGIPTCPICLYRNPGAEPGDTRPIREHDCEDPA